MQIAHCIHGLGLGGAQQVVREIVSRADRGSFRFFVYAAEDGFFRELLEEAGATVRVIPRVLRRFDPAWVARLARAMRRDRIDLVHTHLFGDTLHGFLAARIGGRPHFIMTVHCDLRFQTRLQRLGYRWLLTGPATTVACSGATQRSIESVCRSTSGSVRTIRNGVSAAPVDCRDLEARARGRAELGLDEGAVVIGGIGRLDADKGPDLLVDAFARMVRGLESEPQLLFVGEGPMRDALREQAVREGIADRVTFAGLRRDIRELLPAIDVVAFSSPAEGLSISLLETMAARGCLVATDVPGNREAVSADVEALLVPPGDPAALAAALSRAATDPALRTRLGEAAQKRHRVEFSVEGMVRAYESLYREAAGGALSAAPPLSAR